MGTKAVWCLAARSRKTCSNWLDVIGAVVGREGDAGEQNLDVGGFEGGEDLVEVAAGLLEGQAAQAVVAAELDDDDFRVQAQDGGQAGDSVLGGGATGALVVHLVVIAAGVEFLLEEVGIGLAGLEAVAGGDAVAKADQERATGGPALPASSGPARNSSKVETTSLRGTYTWIV